MKITQIPEAGSLALRLHIGTHTSEIQVQIYKIMENMIVLNPIVINNKILNLGDTDVRMELIYERENEKPIMWRNISYGTVKLENRPYLVLASNSEGAVFNRRNNYRLPLDVKGILNGKDKIIVHDISSTGISFYTPSENKKKVGSPVAIKFTGCYEDIHVSGEIVREIEEEDRNMYGCKIKSSQQIDKFMSEEQRRRVIRSRK